MKGILILTVALLTLAACGGAPEPQPAPPPPAEEKSMLELEAERAADLLVQKLERELEKQREGD